MRLSLGPAGEVLNHIEAAGAVAVVRLRDPARVREVADALAAGGVSIIEVTMTVPGAVGLIRELSAALRDRCLLGAGTVTDVDTARAVINAGARFVVGPVFRPAIIETCGASGVPAIPGCFTPTEIFDAFEAGAQMIKLFPATTLGPSYIKDVRAPLPDLKLIPTGGVTIENAGDWIRAGAAAVGLGSALVDPALVERSAFGEITDRARRLVASITNARSRR
jgi:2-dehydro-3-deoxyphosphogluconate aldolase/(4S)-4-hydroxy-2-oxoglutarate aldolase